MSTWMGEPKPLPEQQEGIAELLTERYANDIRKLHARATYEHPVVYLQISRTRRGNHVINMSVVDGSEIPIPDRLNVYEIETSGSIPVAIRYQNWAPFLACCDKRSSAV